jgi:glycosyltransferase involved in cell wall biosynthesis
VTIVTPSFNQARYLEEAIRSVLLQGYGNLEYIVVDGGSTDGSVELIQRYEPWISSWLSEPDRGQADAINKGFSRASGEIVGWLNSDDVLYPGFIEKRVQEIASMPEVDLIYGDVETGPSCDAIEGVMLGRPTDFESMVRTLEVPIPQQSALWRRGLLDRIGGLDVRWQVVLDREFFLRAARVGNMAYREGVCGLFRLHPNSKSVAEQIKWVEELPKLYREFFADPDLPVNIAQYEDEAMTEVDRLCAQLLWRNGCWRPWLRCVRRSARRSPGHFWRQFLVGGGRDRIRGIRRRLRAVIGKAPAK